MSKKRGVNRESLYKSLKGGAKIRFETVKKLLMAIGVELTVQPIASTAPVLKVVKPAAAVAKKPAAAKLAVAAKPAVPKPTDPKNKTPR